MVTILSIDGGGIRGLLPARILHEMNKRLSASGVNQPFYKLFDLIAGTSTGALIALALALRNEDGSEKFDSSKIVDMYKNRGKDIFPLSYHSAVHTAVQAFRYKYPAEPFEKFLMEFFGEATLKSSETNLLITSFDTEAMEPHCMKRRPERGDWVDDPDYLMRDVARASAAAPTFLPPAYISSIDNPKKKYSLVDGAVFANNPAGLAYVESLKIFPAETEFLILSLGTGNFKHGYSHKDVHSWGYMEWVNPMKGFPIGSIMSAGQSEAVNHQLSRLSNVKYLRMDISIEGSAWSIDDAGENNISNLSTLADRMIEKNNAKIEEVCSMLMERIN